MLPFTDLQNLGNPESLSRNLCRILNEIDFSKFPNLTCFDYSNFERYPFKLSSRNNSEATYDERQRVIGSFFGSIIKKDKLPLNIESSISPALNEAIRNAQKHGNKLDPNKELGLGFRISDSDLDLFVEDSGGVIDGNFLCYRAYVQDNFNNGIIPSSFYDFKEVPTPKNHSGSGTKVIHMSANDVTYHKSDLGGLLVLMNFKR